MSEPLERAVDRAAFERAITAAKEEGRREAIEEVVEYLRSYHAAYFHSAAFQKALIDEIERHASTKPQEPLSGGGGIGGQDE